MEYGLSNALGTLTHLAKRKKKPDTFHNRLINNQLQSDFKISFI